ncbi:MAG: hypothetical protein QOI54_2595 [Actinomycetota bacterium]|jgi:hypothetical protein|nr:hypothetical protein [Actinomycetota bacterium]
MTDARGSAAHWGVAAVVAPAAAAAMALSTGWALQHDPTASSTPVSAAPAAATPHSRLSRSDLALSQAAVAERARVLRLDRTLARLRGQLAAVRQAPLPSRQSLGSGGSTVSRVLPRSSGTVHVARPPVVRRPAPAAPKAHTKTGAS